MKRRIAVRAIVLRGNEILCVRLKQYKPDMSGSHWCTPGGGVDEGEALLPALQREMIEETGIAPVIGELLYVQQFIYKDVDHLEFFYHVTNAEDYETIDLSTTTHGLKEIDEISFINPVGTDVKPVFLATEDIAAHVNTGAPTKVFSYPA